MTATIPPPPPPPPPAAAPARRSVDIGRSFSFVFEDREWVQKIVIGGLFYLLGFLLVGFPFVLGYLARLARRVVAGQEVPLPEWDQMGRDFGEGLRLIVVAIVWALPVFIVMIFWLGGAAILGAMEAPEAVAGCMAGSVMLLFVPLILVQMVFSPAALLFTMVEQDMSAGFAVARIWRFIRNNPGNYVLAIVVYWASNFVAQFGILLLCIGIVFTAFWSLVVTVHAFASAYRAATIR